MWDTLIVMYEGCATSMESTKTTLTRRYERFFAHKNESLTDTHTRFNALVNDLIAIDIHKDDDFLKSKLLDSLPLKWNNYVASVKLSPVYEELDLPGLYGLLHNHECTEAEKFIGMGDVVGSSSSALVASLTEHPNPLCNELVPSQLVDETVETDKPCGSETEYYSSDEIESLADEVALLVERLKRRSFSKFKGKGRSFSKSDKPKKPLDMSKITCYKCGKTGHMANDCRSKTTQSSDKNKPKNSGKDENEKSLVAKDWAESATSSDDEGYEDAQCFMVKEQSARCQDATEKLLDGMTKLREESSQLTQTALFASVVQEVSPFLSLSNEEKLAKLNKLGDEVLLQRHFNKIHKTKIMSLRNEISVQTQFIEKLQSDYKALQRVNVSLLQEAKQDDEKYLKIKHITESWCTSAKRAAKCVNIQGPQ
uniref:uncharacterized protein LOC122609064 n=1 Tax=Erigeron canadensis TaxID=72917 RepID=UPI001CB90957|nr:uncharacterized protein LOC122609064 [Erigeron canadensis]